MNPNPWKCPIQMKPGDQDGDGRLGYRDFAWLIKATEGEDLPEEAFDELCELVGATDKLMTKDQLYASFELGGEEATEVIEEILDKLGALRTKVCNFPWR